MSFHSLMEPVDNSSLRSERADSIAQQAGVAVMDGISDEPRGALAGQFYNLFR
jgi:hypothetical protein